MSATNKTTVPAAWAATHTLRLLLTETFCNRSALTISRSQLPTSALTISASNTKLLSPQRQDERLPKIEKRKKSHNSAANKLT
jgi:hypothetical protein